MNEEIDTNRFRFVIFTTDDGYTQEFYRNTPKFDELVNLQIGEEITVDLTNMFVAMGADKEMILEEYKQRKYRVEYRYTDDFKHIIKIKLKRIIDDKNNFQS